MRNFITLPDDKIDFRSHPLHNKPGYVTLFDTRHNKQLTGTERTTTTYILNDDTDDPACAGSYYLLPDPYCDDANCEKNNLQDFIAEDEEMMLYNQPLITNHSLYKI